ncbi:hypothetical protein [Stenotrophobium rhamnosiphilum]|uniref:Uncharacterized protein n=1 Tax=Stenotrophobium rhamnosiphilum TaxID=2029166 RepID=A0A2T5MKG2_9GAMM|nr:hypothetical protein [Stenotrophobium rhamnosiphilum]PTU33066.1 hypothetical protein CJD38_02885 [Stenotrophobium rhamnosiphilum]
MARKPKVQLKPEPAKTNVDEFSDDLDGLEEEVVIVEPVVPQAKLRDWRDVEKLKEERDLRRNVDDDLDLLDDLIGRAGRRS